MPDSSTSRKVPTLTPLGSHKGAKPVPITRPANIFGSRQDIARFHLNSSTVSKIHAVIVLEDEGAYLHDLGSRMGVYVNHEKVVVANLKDGDEIQIGRFQFQFNANGLPCRNTSAPPATLHVSTLRDPVPMTDRLFQIGKRAGSDLEIAHADVSNIHALIFVRNGQRYIRDLSSRTGTWLDGQPIHQEPLLPGAIVKVGPVTVNYELELDLPQVVSRVPAAQPAPAPTAPTIPAAPVSETPAGRPATPGPDAPIKISDDKPITPPVPLSEDLLETFIPAPTEHPEPELIPLDIDITEPAVLAPDEIVLADDEDTLAPSSAPFHREPLPDDPNLKIVLESESLRAMDLPSAKIAPTDEDDGLDLLRRGWHGAAQESPAPSAEAPSAEPPGEKTSGAEPSVDESDLHDLLPLSSDELVDESPKPSAEATVEDLIDLSDEPPVDEMSSAATSVTLSPVVETPNSAGPAIAELAPTDDQTRAASVAETSRDELVGRIDLAAEPETAPAAETPSEASAEAIQDTSTPAEAPAEASAVPEAPITESPSDAIVIDEAADAESLALEPDLLDAGSAPVPALAEDDVLDFLNDVAPAAETPPVAEAPVAEAPMTEAPGTEAPGTEAPGTEAPSTEAPVTESPVVETPATHAPASGEAPVEVEAEYDESADFDLPLVPADAARHSPGMMDTDPLFVDEDEDLSDTLDADTLVVDTIDVNAHDSHNGVIADIPSLEAPPSEMGPSETSLPPIEPLHVDLTQTAFHDEPIEMSEDAIVIEHDDLEPLVHLEKAPEIIEPTEPTIESALPPVAPVSAVDEGFGEGVQGDISDTLSDSFIAQSLSELSGKGTGEPVDAPAEELEPETESNVSVAHHPDDVKMVDDLLADLDLPTDEELLDLSDVLPPSLAEETAEEAAEATAAHGAPPAGKDAPHPDDIKAVDDIFDGLDLPEPEKLTDIRDLFPPAAPVFGLGAGMPTTSSPVLGGSPILNMADMPHVPDAPSPAPSPVAPSPVSRAGSPGPSAASSGSAPAIPDYKPSGAPMLTSFSGTGTTPGEPERPHVVGFNGAAPAAPAPSPFAGAGSPTATTIADVLVGMRAKTSTDVFANPSPVEVTELATDHLGGGLTTPIERGLATAPETPDKRRQRLKEQDEMRQTYERYRPLAEARGAAPTALIAPGDAFRPGGQLATAIASTLEQAQTRHRHHARRAILLAVLMLILTPCVTVGTYLLSPFGSSVDVSINFDGLGNASSQQQIDFRARQLQYLTNDETLSLARGHLEPNIPAKFLSMPAQVALILKEDAQERWPDPPGTVFHVRMHSRDRNDDIARLEALAKGVIDMNEPLRLEREKLQGNNIALQQQLERNMARVEEIQKELDQLTASGESAPSGDDLARLQRAANAADAALRDAISRRQEIEQSIAALSNAMSSTRPAVPHDADAVRKAEQEVLELQHQAEAARAEFAALQVQSKSKNEEARKRLDAASADVAATLATLDKSLSGNEQLRAYVRAAQESYDRAVKREESRMKREEVEIETMRQAQEKLTALNEARVKDARTNDARLKALTDNLSIDERQFNAASAEGLKSEAASLQLKIKLDKELVGQREKEILDEPVYQEMIAMWQKIIDQRTASIQNDRKITAEANADDQTRLLKLAPPQEQLTDEGRKATAELQKKLADMTTVQKEVAQLSETTRNDQVTQEAALKKRMDDLDLAMKQKDFEKQTLLDLQTQEGGDKDRTARLEQRRQELTQAKDAEAAARKQADDLQITLAARQKLADQYKDVAVKVKSLSEEQAQCRQDVDQARNQIKTNEMVLRSKIIADPNPHTVVNDDKDRRIPYAAAAGGGTFILLAIPFLMSLLTLLRTGGPSSASSPAFTPVLNDHLDDTLTIDSSDDLLAHGAELPALPDEEEQK